MSADQPVDGITPQESSDENAESSKKRSGLGLLLAFIIPYLAFVGWAMFLLSVLPNPKAHYASLIPIGVGSAVGFSVLLILGAVFLSKRVLVAENISDRTKWFGLLKIGFAIIPGIILSIIVSVVIPAEPQLKMSIIDPVGLQNFTAPLSVTFSLQEAAETLRLHGKVPVKYGWDFEGDGIKNDETIEPLATAYYEAKGFYTVAARIYLRDGSQRRITKALSIPKAVFSVSPPKPIVDEPIRLSLAHLESKENTVKEARWDFNDDGEVDEVSEDAHTLHTFLRTGEQKVSVEVQFSNQTQTVYEKTITIHEPEPLPFPVVMKTQPQFLIGSKPFGVLFSIETDEPHRDVLWDFSDGETAIGDRVGHTFTKNDVFRVSAEVRSDAGEVATITEVVKVVDPLRLSDLEFDGTPEVRSNEIIGNVPVDIDLTPLTNVPLIDFFWEAPNATIVESTDVTLKATYRKPGQYLVTLIGVDPAGRVMRYPIKVRVEPPTSTVSVHMVPDGGTAPLLVRFDASETYIPGEVITGFEWKFSNDISDKFRPDSAQVERVFETPGTYEIHLRGITRSGKMYETSRTIVVRPPPLDACFNASRYRGTVPFGVSFDLSCLTGNPDSIEWDFGDGTVNDQEDRQEKMTHVFQKPGTYSVTLTLRDSAGSVSKDVQRFTALPKSR